MLNILFPAHDFKDAMYSRRGAEFQAAPVTLAPADDDPEPARLKYAPAVPELLPLKEGSGR